MPIAGWHGTTLVDYPGRVASVVFFSGCNLRCPFCHNAALVLPPLPEPLKPDAVLHELARRVGFATGVVLTGGEPLLDPDIVSFAQAAAALGFAVKIDTNGMLPKKLASVLPRVDYVALDIKAAPSRYLEATGGQGTFGPVAETLRLLRTSGVNFEVRTTVVPGLLDVADFEEILPWVEGVPLYALQEFVPQNTLDPEYARRPRSSRETLYAIRDRIAGFVGRVDLRAR